MEENKTLAVFDNKKIRRHYDSEKEVWYFSLVDIIEALTESTNPTDYLKKIRKRDPELHLYIGTNCPQVTMLTNGKNRKTLSGNAQHIFRLIQSIPSNKAELLN
jgi:DNA-damage-inducible protein D